MGLAALRLGRSSARQPAENPFAARDRVARGIILGGGLAVLALLAWGHLGLGALLAPPAATAAHQTARAGQYQVSLRLDSGQLTARGPNSISIDLKDPAGHAIAGARVRLAPAMTTMVMIAPTVTASADPGGAYTLHPVFGMAGDWRLTLTISVRGQPDQHQAFDVGVRWS